MALGESHMNVPKQPSCMWLMCHGLGESNSQMSWMNWKIMKQNGNRPGSYQRETMSSVVSEIYLGSWCSHHGVFYNSFFKVCSGLTIVWCSQNEEFHIWCFNDFRWKMTINQFFFLELSIFETNPCKHLHTCNVIHQREKKQVITPQLIKSFVAKTLFCNFCRRIASADFARGKRKLIVACWFTSKTKTHYIHINHDIVQNLYDI